jgi:Secretion system C-terminal sorting domain
MDLPKGANLIFTENSRLLNNFSKNQAMKLRINMLGGNLNDSGLSEIDKGIIERIYPNPTPKIEGKMTISPNPVTDFFTLDLPSKILPATLIITDILGRKINSFSQTETSQRFDFQGDRLDSGLYFLEIKGKNGVTLSRKFVH